MRTRVAERWFQGGMGGSVRRSVRLCRLCLVSLLPRPHLCSPCFLSKLLNKGLPSIGRCFLFWNVLVARHWPVKPDLRLLLSSRKASRTTLLPCRRVPRFCRCSGRQPGRRLAPTDKSPGNVFQRLHLYIFQRCKQTVCYIRPEMVFFVSLPFPRAELMSPVT